MFEIVLFVMGLCLVGLAFKWFMLVHDLKRLEKRVDLLKPNFK